MHIIALGASVNPLEDVNVSATWSGLWAADRYTGASANPLVLISRMVGADTVAPATTQITRGWVR